MATTTRRRRSRSVKLIGPWTGPLIAITVLGYLWVSPLAPAAIAAIAGAVTLWLLFAAPVICWAEGRNDRCRNNATGLLRGCWIRHHKWQKGKLLLSRPSWKKLNRGLWGGPKQNLATISTLLGIITSLRGLLEMPFA